MKKSVMKKWVKALRSGKYEQGIHYLNNGDKYCCLGVLCEVLEIKKVKTHYSPLSSYGENLPLTTSLPAEAMKLSGLKDSVGEITLPKGMVSLVVLNDMRKRSFKQIAAFIERNWEKL